jgi:hypothetical protein
VRSAAWQFFDLLPEDKARCRVPVVRKDGTFVPCGYTLKQSASQNGTSNLFRHLKRHPSQLATARMASSHSTASRAKKAASFALSGGRQPTLTNTLVLPKSLREQHDRRWVIASAVDCLPCNAIGNVGLRVFIGGFCSPYVGQVNWSFGTGCLTFS